jgi:hypothetical protein
MPQTYGSNIFGRGIAEKLLKPQGLSSGEDDSKETTKKIWTEALERAIADTRTNRELAAEIDSLVNIILEFEAFSILGSYEIHSVDDEQHSETIKDITTFVDRISMMGSFREAFPSVRLHGYMHLQKIYAAPKIISETEIKGLKYLQQLTAIRKFEDPFDSHKYYLYQNLDIPEDWRDPTNEKTKNQKVWYIQDGLKGIAQYPKISPSKSVDDPNKADGDIVVDLIDIVEIKNNESGKSSLTACLNEIFIKNHIILNMPNLAYLVLAPGIGVKYQTHDKNGDWMVPHMPLAQLADSDPAEYARQKADYDAFEAENQVIANNLIDNWFKKGALVYPDMIEMKVIESQQRFQAEMLEAMLQTLNKEIAFGLGFPIALVDARGSELSTGREIRAVMSAVLRGIQNQYQVIAMGIIREQFPAETEKAQITITFTELNPKDARELAEIRKLDASVLEIAKKIGASDDDLRALSRKYNLLDEFELGGEGLTKGVAEAKAEVPYSAEELGVSLDMIKRITEDQKAIGIEMESLI